MTVRLCRRAAGISPAVALLCAAWPAAASPTTLPASAAGVTVSVDRTTGTYRVEAKDPAWSFAGTTGSPLERVAAAKGRDAVGAYQEITFRWTNAAGAPLAGAIREYQDRPAVLFAITARGAAGSAPPPPAFPDFTTFPQGLHPFSYTDSVFAGSTFGLSSNATPWLLFDDRGARAAVLSPASDFFVARMQGGGAAAASLASGLRPELTSVPAGFTHRTLLVLGQGIVPTFLAWGNTLGTLQGRHRPASDADPLLKYLSYWTDNGADYYYNYDLSKGYAGTLLALRDRYREERIPVRSLQLDSWWYQKSKLSADRRLGKTKNPNLPEGTWNAYGGTLQYTASPALFPQGLGAFQRELGLPLVVHGRWIDWDSPYRQNYKISGVAPVDRRWWDDTARYLKQNGVITYEQDWLVDLYRYSPEMASTLGTGEAFTDGMADACKAQGLTLQYCMATPRFFLQGTKYDNLTTIRVSDDRFERRKWGHFLYTSLLARALGIWPWVDVFKSRETENLLLAALSAGPVGAGDALGAESKENLLLAARPDGVLVKPDVPIVPTDDSFLADARREHHPLVAATYTDHGPLRTAYVFAFARPVDTGDLTFTPGSLGIGDGSAAYVYDWFAKTAKRVVAGAPYQAALPGGSDKPGSAYYLVAPVGASGIALFGDAGKFAGMGRQRIPDVRDTPDGLVVTVAFAPGEGPVTLHGCAASAPAAASSGTVGPVAYDTATQHFTVTLSPAARARTTVALNGEKVQEATVTLRLVP